MGRPIDIKSFKKANRTAYNRIYAEGYQDAYRQLKSSGQIQLYRIDDSSRTSLPAIGSEASPNARNELAR
jgi:hypothetical protein